MYFFTKWASTGRLDTQLAKSLVPFNISDDHPCNVGVPLPGEFNNSDLPSMECVIIIVRIGLPRILQFAPRNPTRDLILSARNSLSSAR